VKKATVLPVGVTREGVVHGAVQHEDRTVSLGVFRPLREGQPISDPAAVCELERRPGTPLFEATFPFADAPEVAPVAPAAPTATGHKGPAKINSEGYRDAWERIFGSGEAGEA
jgi:hypothetical protein